MGFTSNQGPLIKKVLTSPLCSNPGTMKTPAWSCLTNTLRNNNNNNTAPHNVYTSVRASQHWSQVSQKGLYFLLGQITLKQGRR